MTKHTGLGTQLRLLVAKLDGDVQAIYDSLGAPFRPRFFPIVQQLMAQDSASVGELAQATGVTQPAATQTIGEMSRLGLLQRSESADARERRVSLTADGRALAGKLQPTWDAVAGAARQLDTELPCPLSDILAAALDALAREPFEQRIRKEMQ